MASAVMGCGATSSVAPRDPTTGLVLPTVVHGTVAPGFESVRSAFEQNLEERGEAGAAIAVFHRGKKVVDLWGGERNAEHEPWLEDTLVPVLSLIHI